MANVSSRRDETCYQASSSKPAGVAVCGGGSVCPAKPRLGGIRLALVIFFINDVLVLWESEAQEEHSSIEVISE